MSNIFKNNGFQRSGNDENKWVQPNTGKTVTETSYGLKSNDGSKLHSHSTSKKNDYLSGR